MAETKEMLGAIVERGKVKAVKDDGYEVESIDRYGIETSKVYPIDNSTYQVGDYVYFFAFRDGTGGILSKVKGR